MKFKMQSGLASKERRELVCTCVAVWRVPEQGLSGSGGHRGGGTPQAEGGGRAGWERGEGPALVS